MVRGTVSASGQITKIIFGFPFLSGGRILELELEVEGSDNSGVVRRSQIPGLFYRLRSLGTPIVAEQEVNLYA